MYLLKNVAQAGPVFVVPYNDAAYLEQIFAEHGKEIAAFILEPVMENLSVVLPDAGYLEHVRHLCDKFRGHCAVADDVGRVRVLGPAVVAALDPPDEQ